MKVLMTTVPAEAGGGIAGLHQLIAGNNDSIDLVFCPAASKSPFSEPVVTRAARAVQYFFKVASLLIRDPAIEVVHVNTAPDNKAVLRDSLVVLAARICGRRVVIQIHGGIGDYRRAGIVKLLARNCLRNCQAILVFTLQDKQIVDSVTLAPLKTSIIPNAVVVKDFDPGTGITEEAGKRELTVLFLSRLIAEKGVFELIAAIESIVTTCQGVRFVFAGEGPARSDMEAACSSRGIRKWVTFTGQLGYQEVVKAYRGADIFVLPSYSEAMPMTILQALAAGLPIVATRAGAIPELLQDGVHGYLVDKKDSAQLAEKIVALLKDDALREQMGRTNRQLAWERYDIQVLIGQLKRLYTALAESPVQVEEQES